MSDSPGRARNAQSLEPMWPPPQRAPGRLGGKAAVAPLYLLRALGLERAELTALYGDSGQSYWWGASFEMGRAPFDSKFCAVWRALFEYLPPIERSLAPVYRRLIRLRAAALQGSSVVDHEDVRPMGFETDSYMRKLGDRLPS